MRLLSAVCGSLCLSLAAMCAVAFHQRYWLWRGCFNELGRCWDSESQEVYLEQAGIIWGGAALLFLALAIAALRPRRARRTGS